MPIDPSILQPQLRHDVYAALADDRVSAHAGDYGEVGMANGFALQMEADPLQELQDSMEELSFLFEEPAEKTVAERKLGETRRAPGAAMRAAIERWQEILPDMPNGDILDRFLRIMRQGIKQENLNPQDILRMLEEESQDPSVIFAMLESLQTALTQDEKKLADIIKQVKDQLGEKRGPEIRAGINIAQEVNARSQTTAGIQDLRNLYRGQILGFTTPQDCFQALLAQRGAGRLQESISFLLAACSTDLQATTPSTPPEELRRIILDLQCVEVLHTVLERMDNLADRMTTQFRETLLMDGEKMTGRVIDMTKLHFMNGATVGGFVDACGLQRLLSKVDFGRELTSIFRSLSARLFQKDSDRTQMIDAAQEYLDGVVEEEEDQREDAEEEDAHADAQAKKNWEKVEKAMEEAG